MSDPETISWRDALDRIVQTCGSQGAARMLLEAVVSNAVGYYPRKALSLDRAAAKGLFDLKTGAWRMHARDDQPFFVRLIRSEFDRWLLRQRPPSKAGSETAAVAFLAEKLNADHDLTRSDAWVACKATFPNLSQRRFGSLVWPNARTQAGLPPLAHAGRKKRSEKSNR